MASTGASTSSPLVANFLPSFPDELAAHGYRGNAGILEWVASLGDELQVLVFAPLERLIRGLENPGLILDESVVYPTDDEQSGLLADLGCS